MSEIIVIKKEELDHLIDEKIKLYLEQTKTNNESDNLKKDELLSRKDTAKLLKITLPTLNRYSKQGFITSYKMGNRVIYKRHEVIESLVNIGRRK